MRLLMSHCPEICKSSFLSSRTLYMRSKPPQILLDSADKARDDQKVRNTILFIFRQRLISLIGASLYLVSLNSFGVEAAPVSGMARSFLLNRPIPYATITVLESGLKIQTDQNGNFGPFWYPVQQPLTLEFSKFGYQTTQSETLLVTKAGIKGRYQHITFQVPSLITYYAFAALIGARLDANSCHVATTITRYHQTLDDLPQGEAHAKLILKPLVQERPFYFGIFSSGIFKHKTNPFIRDLASTSEDGGAAFFNLPPRNEPYELSAEKSGKAFTKTFFTCRKGAFINISPPRGPMASQ